jgi:hypothetical protein
MSDLKRKVLAAVLTAGFAVAGAFAQKQEDKRPKKDPGKVVSQPKDQKPPPNRNNQDKNKGDKRGKP